MRPAPATSGGSSAHARALAILRILIGVFFIFEGIGRLAWLTDSGPLVRQLSGWVEGAAPYSRVYLETVAMPYAPIFARAVVLGEIAAGTALVLGFWTRIAAALAFLMVLNVHVASSAIFRYSFLTNGYGLPVLGSLLALAVGGAKLPWSLKK